MEEWKKNRLKKKKHEPAAYVGFVSPKGQVVKRERSHILSEYKIDHENHPKKRNLHPDKDQPDPQQIARQMEEERLSLQMAQVEQARRIAEEQQTIAHIMQENRVDVSDFIAEGRKLQTDSGEWTQAQKQEQIHNILEENKVDVSAFVEEGLRLQHASADGAEESRQDNSTQAAELSQAKQEELKLAQEIFERLQREAMEDEQKKQAEIDEAMRQAKETFG